MSNQDQIQSSFLRRLQFTAYLSTTYFLWMIIWATVVFFRIEERDFLQLVAGFALPSFSTVVFSIICIFVPSLLGRLKMEAPLNFTLPTIFCFICFAVKRTLLGDVLGPLPILSLPSNKVWNPDYLFLIFWVIFILINTLQIKRSLPSQSHTSTI